MASPFRVENGVVTYNGKPVEEMTEEEKKNAYGSAGNIRLGEVQTFDFSAGNKMPNINRDYFEEYEINLGDAGTTTGYRLKPEYERMQGMAQVGAPRSVGGQGEPIDPSLITYDEEFGYITPITNIKPPDSTFLQEFLPYIAAAGTLAAIGAVGGFAGLGIAGAGEGVAAGVGEGVAGGATTGGVSGGSGIVAGATETVAAGTGTAAGGTTLGQYAGMTTGLDGLSTASLTAGGGATNIASTTAALGGAGTGGSILGSAGEWFSNLSPTSQRILASAVGQGASAISASRRQQEAQDFAREQSDINYQRRREEEERAAEERRVRGTPQAYTFNITPRPRAGIIGGGMGG